MKNFKKVAVFVCVLLALSMSGCNKNQSQEIKQPESATKTVEVNEENILLKVDEANKRDALMKNNEKVGYISTDIFLTGKNETVFSYQDKDKYVRRILDGERKYFEVDHQGEVFLYDEGTQKYSTRLFVDDKAYEEYYYLASFEYDPLEKVISVIEKDGRFIIKAEVTDEKNLLGASEYFGYKNSEVVKVTCCYEVDAKTYELYSGSYILNFKDGTNVKYSSFERVETYEEYMPSEELMNYDISSLEKRTATIIENPGTPDEIKKEYSIPSGVGCGVVVSSEHDQVVYADPEFKIESGSDEDMDIDFSKDFTVYIRKKQ